MKQLGSYTQQTIRMKRPNNPSRAAEWDQDFL